MIRCVLHLNDTTDLRFFGDKSHMGGTRLKLPWMMPGAMPGASLKYYACSSSSHLPSITCGGTRLCVCVCASVTVSLSVGVRTGCGSSGCHNVLILSDISPMETWLIHPSITFYSSVPSSTLRFVSVSASVLVASDRH